MKETITKSSGNVFTDPGFPSGRGGDSGDVHCSDGTFAVFMIHLRS
jgi:hypothetical protein